MLALEMTRSEGIPFTPTCEDVTPTRGTEATRLES